MDFAYLALTMLLLASTFGLVVLCARLSPRRSPSRPAGTPPDAKPSSREEPMPALYVIGAIVSLVLLGYLFFALLLPEKFQ